MNVMQGFVETIHLFKTRPDIVVPLLQRYVKIEDRKAAEEFVRIPCAGISKGSATVISGNAGIARVSCGEIPDRHVAEGIDIADSSFIDELERSGFIDRLYAADRK